MRMFVRVLQGSALAVALVALAAPLVASSAGVEPAAPANVDLAVAPSGPNPYVTRKADLTVGMTSWQETFTKRRPTDTFRP